MYRPPIRPPKPAACPRVPITGPEPPDLVVFGGTGFISIDLSAKLVASGRKVRVVSRGAGAETATVRFAAGRNHA